MLVDVTSVVDSAGVIVSVVCELSFALSSDANSIISSTLILSFEFTFSVFSEIVSFLLTDSLFAESTATSFSTTFVTVFSTSFSVTFSTVSDDEEVDVYEIEINELVNLPNGKNIVRVSDSDDNSNNVIRLSSSDIVLPLFVRTRRNGDKMIVKGMNGHKKVNDIFIDNKISTKDRQVWPVVCDAENNIVWVPGLKKSKFDVENGKKCDIILKYY